MIILLGPPGCGKGTVAKELKAKYQYIHLSTGELIRSKLKHDKELREIINQGMFADDSMINNIIKQHLSKLSENEKKNLLLDGYPRNCEQATFLESLGSCEHVFLIDISEDICITRISNRGEGRVDDNPETAKKRWDLYLEVTKPLIDFYTHKGLLRRIDGSKRKEAVLEMVLKYLDK
ncbi:adenylate kinase [Cucumispora dikerogammari]|nr:adenylate kinase [Cucumispora dikerogammari]